MDFSLSAMAKRLAKRLASQVLLYDAGLPTRGSRRGGLYCPVLDPRTPVDSVHGIIYRTGLCVKRAIRQQIWYS